jgi:hypothetical protein
MTHLDEESFPIFSNTPVRGEVKFKFSGDPKTLLFRYTNWEGKKSLRRVIPMYFLYDSTENHSEPQWLMYAHDVDKDGMREFVLKDCDFSLGWEQYG